MLLIFHFDSSNQLKGRTTSVWNEINTRFTPLMMQCYDETLSAYSIVGNTVHTLQGTCINVTNS